MLNTIKFSKKIEDIVNTTGLAYMEAILHYCDNNQIEIEIAAKLLSEKILIGIEEEAIQNRLLKDNRRYGSLPV